MYVFIYFLLYLHIDIFKKCSTFLKILNLLICITERFYLFFCRAARDGLGLTPRSFESLLGDRSKADFEMKVPPSEFGEQPISNLS